MQPKKIIILSLWISFLCSCNFSCKKSELFIISYNVHNLFDAVYNGSEYPEFIPNSGKWTEKLFQQKLKQILKVLKAINAEGADLILLQEIENKNVLRSLAAELFSPGETYYLVAPDKPSSSTCVGIISRFPVIETAVHSLQFTNSIELREILEVRILVHSEEWVIFNNHWKSKREGAFQTEKFRLAAASLIVKRLGEILKTNLPAAILLGGDLNESHNEYLLNNRQYLTALMPLTEAQSLKSFSSVLLLTSSLAEIELKSERVVFLQPWLVYQTNPEGSYWYAGSWESLDHILWLPLKSEWEIKNFSVFARDFMLNPSNGTPLIWSKSNPTYGCSDHLPLVLHMIRR